MGTITYGIPQSGLPNASEDVKVATALTQLLTLVNGNIDGTNIAATLAQSAGVNGVSVVKGVSVNVGPGTRTNTVYGALNDAPDQVAGIVLPTNGLIAVRFQGTWQETVSAAASAAIFVGANQLQIAGPTGPVGQFTSIGPGGIPGNNVAFSSSAAGLACDNSDGSNYTGDVSTGQVVGQRFGTGDNGNGNGCESGVCHIFAAAGTYTISVQFKASSGTVTVSNRRLWVEAKSFS